MANIQIIQGDFKKKLKLPIAEGLKAGFPSPAEDYSHETLDFNRDLIRNPEATFYGKVEGDVPSKHRMGILSLDISMMSSPSNTSTYVTVRTAILSYVLPTRTSSLSALMPMMTLKCGAW